MIYRNSLFVTDIFFEQSNEPTETQKQLLIAYFTRTLKVLAASFNESRSNLLGKELRRFARMKLARSMEVFEQNVIKVAESNGSDPVALGNIREFIVNSLQDLSKEQAADRLTQSEEKELEQLSKVAPTDLLTVQYKRLNELKQKQEKSLYAKKNDDLLLISYESANDIINNIRFRKLDHVIIQSCQAYNEEKIESTNKRTRIIVGIILMVLGVALIYLDYRNIVRTEPSLVGVVHRVSKLGISGRLRFKAILGCLLVLLGLGFVAWDLFKLLYNRVKMWINSLTSKDNVQDKETDKQTLK